MPSSSATAAMLPRSGGRAASRRRARSGPRPPLGELGVLRVGRPAAPPRPRTPGSSAAALLARVAGLQPQVLGLGRQQIAGAQVAGAQPLAPRHPLGREQRVGAGQQHGLVQGDVLGAGGPGDGHRPAPAPVPGLLALEEVGDDAVPVGDGFEVRRRPCPGAAASSAASRASSTASAHRRSGAGSGGTALRVAALMQHSQESSLLRRSAVVGVRCRLRPRRDGRSRGRSGTGEPLRRPRPRSEAVRSAPFDPRYPTGQPEPCRSRSPSCAPPGRGRPGHGSRSTGRPDAARSGVATATAPDPSARATG